MAAVREEAQVQLALGRQARAAAVAAEGLRHAADHADLAAAVFVRPALGGLAGSRGFERAERKFGGDARDDLGRRHHLVHAPTVGGADVHVFDETQHDAGALEVPRHGQDLGVVGAALDDHVDLDRPEPGGAGGLDAGEHVGHREIDVVHAAEHRVVQAVEAHGHALQPGGLERGGLAHQQRAVGGERQVERLPVGRAQGGKLADERLDVLAQQRLAAGQPDLAHPVRREQSGQAGDFLEAQQRAVRQVLVVLVEHFLGHAVAAAEVAPVGHADAEVGQGATETIAQQAGRRHGLQRRRGHAACASDVGEGDEGLGHGAPAIYPIARPTSGHGVKAGGTCGTRLTPGRS